MKRFWRIVRLGVPGVARPISAARRIVTWWAVGSLAIGAVVGWLRGDVLTGVGIGLLVLLVAIALTGWQGAFALARELEAFEAAPLLELAYDNSDPTCHQEDWVDPTPRNWLGAERYRVRLTNRSPKTIDTVTLSLVRFEPQGAPFLPMPLKAVGDDMGVRSIDEALHAGDRRYYEVAWVGFDKEGRVGEITLAYARSGVPNMISADRRYELELRAQGRDTPPVWARFEVWVEDRRLRFSGAGADAAALRARLNRQRNQAFADVLTDRRKLAIDILNRPTNSPSLLAAWQESSAAWRHDVLALMRAQGCTPQQVASLESLGDVSIGAYDVDPPINKLKSVHAEALRRLERIIDDYSAERTFRG